jgi:hypothetical protein
LVTSADVDRALQLPTVAGVDLLLQLGLLGQQRIHLVIVERLGELGRDLVEAVELRLGLGHAHHDVAQHVLGRIELRLLLEIADLDAVRGPGLAADVLVDPGHDPEQRRLARAVDAEHADLRTREEG